MPEADDHGLAEVSDAVGKRAQVAVVATRGDHRDRGQGGSHCRIVTAPCWLTVSANEVWKGSPSCCNTRRGSVAPHRLREICDPLIGPGWSGLIYAQVRGRGRW